MRRSELLLRASEELGTDAPISTPVSVSSVVTLTLIAD